MFWHTSAICVVYSNLKDSFHPRNGIKSWTFSCDYSVQLCIDELNSIFGNETPSRTRVYQWYGEFKRGHSLLQDEFREACPKSVVVPETIDAVHQLLQNRHVGPAYIQYCMNIWLSKKFISVASHTICQSLKKKGSYRLVETKIRSRFFETCLWHRDSWCMVDLRVLAQK